MKSKKILAIALAAVSVGSLAAFTSCGGNNKEKSLNITGSSSVAPLMSVLAEAYKKTTEVKITVTTSDSGTGIQDTKNGLNDFGMASRALKSTETGIVSKQIATDGITIIVKKDSAVDNVTSKEMYDLYANGTPIQTIITAGITREAGSGTRDAFGELITDGAGNSLKKLPTLASVITQQNGTDGVKTEISSNMGLIGYISMGSMDSTVKALSFENVAATVENVKNGSYKLCRPFNIVYQSEEKLSDEAKAFIAYIMSEDGQKIVSSKGYITVA